MSAPPDISASDWALIAGVVIALGQNVATRLQLRRHRRHVEDWTQEASDQHERLLRALRLCRAAEKRCNQRYHVLERRLDGIEEFHGPGKCIPQPDDWEPPDEPGWPMDEPGRWR